MFVHNLNPHWCYVLNYLHHLPTKKKHNVLLLLAEDCYIWWVFLAIPSHGDTVLALTVTHGDPKDDVSWYLRCVYSLLSQTYPTTVWGNVSVQTNGPTHLFVVVESKEESICTRPILGHVGAVTLCQFCPTTSLSLNTNHRRIAVHLENKTVCYVGFKIYVPEKNYVVDHFC